MHFPNPRLELERLVLEQIHRFKQPEKMSNADIFEHHLRHYRIFALYRQLDRTKSENARLDDKLEESAWAQFVKTGWQRV